MTDSFYFQLARNINLEVEKYKKVGLLDVSEIYESALQKTAAQLTGTLPPKDFDAKKAMGARKKQDEEDAKLEASRKMKLEDKDSYSIKKLQALVCVFKKLADSSMKPQGASPAGNLNSPSMINQNTEFLRGNVGRSFKDGGDVFDQNADHDGINNTFVEDTDNSMALESGGVRGAQDTKSTNGRSYNSYV